MVRKGQQNVLPSADMVLAAGDGLMVIADQQDAIGEAARASESWSPAGS